MAKSISATSLKVNNPKAPAVRREAEEPCVGGVTHCRFDNHDCRPRKRNVGDEGKAVGRGPPTALLFEQGAQYKISKTKLSISMIAVTPATESTKASLASW